MKKYTFTLTITETTTSEVVTNILEKVAQENKIKEQLVENNRLVVEQMKKVLDVVYNELTELLEPLNLALSSHYRNQGFTTMKLNCYGFSLETKIGGVKEHSGTYRDAVFVRIYCPYENGKLTFIPKLVMYGQDTFNQSRPIDFTTSENLIETFSKEIEKMYRNNF